MPDFRLCQSLAASTRLLSDIAVSGSNSSQHLVDAIYLDVNVDLHKERFGRIRSFDRSKRSLRFLMTSFLRLSPLDPNSRLGITIWNPQKQSRNENIGKLEVPIRSVHEYFLWSCGSSGCLLQELHRPSGFAAFLFSEYIGISL